MSGEQVEIKQQLPFTERFSLAKIEAVTLLRDEILTEARELEDQFSAIDVVTEITSPPLSGIIGTVRGEVIDRREDNNGNLQRNQIILTVEGLYECGTIEMRHNTRGTLFLANWLGKQTSDELWLEYADTVALKLKTLKIINTLNQSRERS